MKKVLGVVLFFANTFVQAQSVYKEELLIPPYSNVIPTDAIELPDENILISGFVHLNGSASNHEFFCKLDANGQVSWLKIMADSSIYNNGSLFMKYGMDGIIHTVGTKCSDLDTSGNILNRKVLSYCGRVAPFGNGYKVVNGDVNGIYINDLDSDYNISSSTQKVVLNSVPGNYINDERIKSTSDGGYVLSGVFHKQSGSFSRSFLFLVKVDSLSQMQWHKVYKSASIIDSTFAAPEVFQTSTGDYLVGCINNNSNPEKNYLLKLDNLGNVKWGKSFGNYSSYVRMSEDLNTGNYFFSMAMGPVPNFGPVNFVGALKTDTAFNIINCYRHYRDSLTIGRGEPFLKLNNNQCFIYTNYAFNNLNLGAYLIKTNSDLSTYCDDSLCSFTDTIYDVIESPDTITMTTDSFPLTSTSILIEWTSNYSLVPYCQLTGFSTQEENEPIELFPNPATTQFTITTSKSSIKEITIYNTLGEKVYSKQLSSISYKLSIDLSFLRQGIYYISVQTRGEVYRRKIVKE